MQRPIAPKRGAHGKIDGTVPVRRKRLNTHLQTLAVEFRNSKLVQVRPSLEKPTSICAASENNLLGAHDA